MENARNAAVVAEDKGPSVTCVEALERMEAQLHILKTKLEKSARESENLGLIWVQFRISEKKTDSTQA